MTTVPIPAGATLTVTVVDVPSGTVLAETDSVVEVGIWATAEVAIRSK
jgi:hypothetical protein